MQNAKALNDAIWDIELALNGIKSATGKALAQQLIEDLHEHLKDDGFKRCECCETWKDEEMENGVCRKCCEPDGARDFAWNNR